VLVGNSLVKVYRKKQMADDGILQSNSGKVRTRMSHRRIKVKCRVFHMKWVKVGVHKQKTYFWRFFTRERMHNEIRKVETYSTV
jgi:hypothetical protein